MTFQVGREGAEEGDESDSSLRGARLRHQGGQEGQTR